MPKTRLVTRWEDELRKRRELEDQHDRIVNEAISIVVEQCTSIASDDNNKIARTARGFDLLKNACFTLLLERAQALGSKRKYSEAIADAKKAIEYQPESADGYITANYLYTATEQLQKAIEILELGSHTVAPAQRPLFDGYLRAAKELAKQKIDFVPMLPTELTINIFTQLDKHVSLVECVRVSKSWRDFLLQQCPFLWREVKIEYNRFNATACLLPSITNYVRKLEVIGDDPDYRSLFKKLINTLESKGLPHLYDIYIRIPSYDQVVEFSMQIITPVRHQLTRIFLSSDEQGSDGRPLLPMDLVLDSCPNLETLDLLFGGINNVAYQPSQSTPRNYRLKKLILTAANTDSVFELLIPRCPELEYLESHKCGSKNLALINQHCPRFRELHAGEELYAYPKPLSDDDHLGLYNVQYEMHNSDEMQQLIPMIVKSKNTLVTLVLVIQGTTTVGALNQLAHHTFSRLEILKVYVENDVREFGSVAARIIPQCPMLKDVALGLNVEAPGPAFDYLTILPHLKILYLCGIVAPSDNFQRLFAHYSKRGEACTLESIRISYCNDITDDVLNAMSGIKTLQEIAVDGGHGDINVTPDGILTFTSNLLALSNLKHTDLSGVPYIPVDAARQLAKINELNR